MYDIGIGIVLTFGFIGYFIYLQDYNKNQIKLLKGSLVSLKKRVDGLEKSLVLYQIQTLQTNNNNNVIYEIISYHGRELNEIKDKIESATLSDKWLLLTPQKRRKDSMDIAQDEIERLLFNDTIAKDH